MGDESQLTAALGKATAQVEGFAGNLQKVGSKLKSTGAAMTRNLTLPLVVAGGAATKYAYDFDQSMNHIQALVGANTKQMAGYRDAILKLSPAVGQGPKELADALYFVTSSGYKGAAALDVLKASAIGAATGLGDTQTIADLVTSAVTVYGQKNLSASKAVDVLTQAVKDGKGEPAEYATTLGRVIPVANALGISFDQSAAALASLTLAGFSADKAATGLTSIFTNLSKPTTTGAAALKAVGLSYAGIRHEITDKGLLPALMTLNKAFDGNQVQLRKVFSSGKAIVPFLALTGQAAGKTAQVFNDLAHSAGASQQAFAVQSQTTAFKVQQAIAKIQVAAVQVGSILLPIFASVATRAASLASAFGELPAGMQEVAVAAAIAVAALGPLLSVMGNISLVSSKVVTGFAKMTAAATLADAAMTPFGAGLIILGAAAVGVGIYMLVTAGHTDQMKAAMDRAKQAATDLGTALSGLSESHLHVKEATQAHKEAAQALTQAERDQTKAIQQYGKGSQQAIAATNAVADARNNLGETTLRLGQAEHDLYAATAKNKAALEGNAKALAAIGDAAVTSSRPVGRAAMSLKDAGVRALVANEAFQKWQAGVAASGDAASRAAANMKNGLTPELRRGKVEAAAMAIGALDLGKKIGGIPSEHRILVHYLHDLGPLIKEALQLQQAINSLHSKVVSIVTNYHVTGHTAQSPGSNAAGTNYWPGGWTWVNERGPELLNLPRGTQIKSHAESVRMASGAGSGGGGGGTVNLTVNMGLLQLPSGSEYSQFLNKFSRDIQPHLNRHQARHA